MNFSKSFAELSAVNIEGENVQFDRYLGHPVIVVNVASQWGFTDKEYSQVSYF